MKLVTDNNKKKFIVKDEVLENFLSEYDEFDRQFISMEDIDFTDGYIEL